MCIHFSLRVFHYFQSRFFPHLPYFVPDFIRSSVVIGVKMGLLFLLLSLKNEYRRTNRLRNTRSLDDAEVYAYGLTKSTGIQMQHVLTGLPYDSGETRSSTIISSY